MDIPHAYFTCIRMGNSLAKHPDIYIYIYKLTSISSVYLHYTIPYYTIDCLGGYITYLDEEKLHKQRGGGAKGT